MSSSLAERLASHMLVGTLVRRAASAGGFATILHKGDPISGIILLLCMERGVANGLYERVADIDGGCSLLSCGPAATGDLDALTQYIARRTKSDPDLWLVELDIAEAERFAAETIC